MRKVSWWEARPTCLNVYEYDQLTYVVDIEVNYICKSLPIRTEHPTFWFMYGPAPYRADDSKLLLTILVRTCIEKFFLAHLTLTCSTVYRGLVYNISRAFKHYPGLIPIARSSTVWFGTYELNNKKDTSTIPRRFDGGEEGNFFTIFSSFTIGSN